MGLGRVVALSPTFNRASRIGEGKKPMLIQAFVPHASVERFDESVVHRFPRPTEDELHVVVMRPSIERLALKLRPVVNSDPLG